MLDLGATYHLARNSRDLQFSTPYIGKQSVIIGNGTSFSIQNHKNGVVYVNREALSLNNLLHTPAIPSKLILIKCLCADNNVIIEFIVDSFSIKRELK